MHEFFLVGGVAFYILLAAAFISLWISISFESGIAATITLVATIASLAFFGNFNIFHSIHHSPWKAVIFVAIYLFVGLIWSFIKFRFYMSDRRRQLDVLLDEFFRDSGATELNDTNSSDWRRKLAFSNFSSDVKITRQPDGNEILTVRPQAKRHKAQITTWAAYWPWSLTWALLHDAIHRLWEEVYHTLHSWYQKIADHAFKGTDVIISKPLPVPTEQPV